MSQIIRDAIVRLKLEQQKAKLEAPDVGPSVRAYEAEKKAADEAAKSTQAVAVATNQTGEAFKRQAKEADTWAAGLKKVNDEWRKSGSGRDSWGEGLARMTGQREAAAASEKKAVEEAARAQQELVRVQSAATQQMLVNFREGGEGALRMARGIAFLSASGSEDLRKLMQTVAMAQGAFDVFAGGFKVFTNIGAVFGPVGIAVAGVTAAVLAGAAAWRSYAERTAEATRRIEESRKANAELLAQHRETQARIESGGQDLELDVMRRLTGATVTPESRERQVRANRQRLQEMTDERSGEVENYISRFSAVPIQGEVRRELERRERGLLSVIEDRTEVEREIFETERRRVSEFGAASVFGAGAGVSGGPLALGAIGAAFPGAEQFQRLLTERNQQFEEEQKKLIEIFRRTNERLLQIENAANGGG